ncbi:MAG: YlxR family protein [Kofleriaceae bacterium]
MAVGGLVLSAPLRTCTGCRAVVAQAELVRVAVDGSRLVVDRARRIPGRGAYVHPVASCVTIAGLARSLRRTVTPADIQRLVTELSRAGDNSSSSPTSSGDPSEIPDDLNPGLAGAITVETTPRIKAKDDLIDARV